MVEVVTDKVNAEVPAPVSGTLTAISAQEGQTVAVGQPICEIAETGGAAVAASAPEVAAAPAANPAVPAAPSVVPAAALAAPTAASAVGATDSTRARSSPYVRRLAQEAGV
ncbi:Biotin/lipoyl attachment domain protein, partial [mine drainage metagenome]